MAQAVNENSTWAKAVRTAAAQRGEQLCQRTDRFFSAFEGQIVDRHHAAAIAGDAHGIGGRRSSRQRMCFIQKQQFSPQQLLSRNNAPCAGDLLGKSIGDGAALRTRRRCGGFRRLRQAIFPDGGLGNKHGQKQCRRPCACQQKRPASTILCPALPGLPVLRAPAARLFSGCTDILSAPFPLGHKPFGHAHPSRG